MFISIFFDILGQGLSSDKDKVRYETRVCVNYKVLFEGGCFATAVVYVYTKILYLFDRAFPSGW